MKLSLIICVIFFVSCATDPSEIPDENNVPPLEFFIIADVNGDTIETMSQPSNIIDYSSGISYNTKTDADSNCINRSYSSSLVSVTGNLPEFKIEFINLLDELTMTCDGEEFYFENFLESQDYSYAENALGEGVSVKYRTSSNTSFYTSYNVQPSTPKFEVTQIEIVDCSPKKCIHISGNFEVSVYKTNDLTDVLTLTNGEFKLRLQSQN